MKLKPIRSDLELDRALERIDELWGARPGAARASVSRRTKPVAFCGR